MKLYGYRGRLAALAATLALAACSNPPPAPWETYRDAGRQAQAQGRFGEAEAQFQTAIKRAEEFGKEDPRYLESMESLGEIYMANGEYTKAEPVRREILRIRKQKLGPEHPDVIDSVERLGRTYFYQSKFAESEPLFRRVLDAREKALGPQDRAVAASLDQVGGVYLNQKQFEKAEPFFQRALSIREKFAGSERAAIARSLENLSSLHLQQDRCAEGLEYQRRAVTVYEEVVGPDSPEVGGALQNLGRSLARCANNADAQLAYERAVKIAEKGRQGPQMGPLLEEYAAVLRKLDRINEAEALIARAQALRVKPGS
jgi:tetratricopeptide (TPR) repeat protein